MSDDPKTNPMPLQGEGDYIGAGEFQRAQAKYAKEGPVGEKSREAADALDGPEAAELEAARAAAARGETA
jgi:hypothetical protein